MSTQQPKTVGIRDKRNYACITQNITFTENAMSKQAKTLNTAELRRVLDYVATRKHSLRNRAMLLTTHYAGLRVGEVAALRYNDVVDANGDIRTEVHLAAHQTKNKHARTVFLNEKLRKELQQYVNVVKPINTNVKLFYSQKKASDGFTANTLTQFFHYLYKRVGLDGASSHSGRRTFITNLAARGVGVRVLMSLAGHRNISTTQAYIDVNDDMKRKAVELI